MSTLEIAWTPPQGATIDEYRLRKRRPPDGDLVEIGSTRATSMRHEMSAEGEVEFLIAPVVGGREVDPDKWTSVRTNLEAAATHDVGYPDDVTNFVVAQQENRLLAQWDPSTEPQADRYEIRMGSTWALGIEVASVPVGQTSTSFGVWHSGSTTFWIKVVTRQGLYSVTGASCVVVIRSDDYSTSMSSTDEGGGGFAATKSGTEVSGGHLRPTQFSSIGSAFTVPASTTPWWYTCERSGTYVTGWTDAGAVVDQRIEVNPTATTVDTAPNFDTIQAPIRPDVQVDDDEDIRATGARVPGDEVNIGGTLVRGIRLKIEIDTAQDGVPTPDGYRIWVPGATYQFRQYRLRFTFDVLWPFVYPKLTGLTHSAWRLNKKAEGSVTIASTGGTDITFPSGRFTASPNVTGNLIHASNPYYVTFSNLSSSGAKVRIWDAAGTEQSAGTVHWHALGV